MLSFLFCAVALAVLSVVVVVMVVVVVAVMDWAAAAVVVELAEGVVGVEGLWRRGSFRTNADTSTPPDNPVIIFPNLVLFFFNRVLFFFLIK